MLVSLSVENDNALRANLENFKNNTVYITDLFQKINETNQRLQVVKLNLIELETVISVEGILVV